MHIMSFSIRSYVIASLLFFLLASASSETHEKYTREQVNTQQNRLLLPCITCHEFDDDGTLVDAVWTWFHDKEIATKLFGHISCWGVGKVTSMTSLFSFRMNEEAASFDEDLSCWDTSNVDDMKQMFRGAKEFNSDIQHWDVNNVKTMEHMFWGASSFNAKIQHWDTSSVTNMRGMFEKATSFNRCVSKANVFCDSDWDVSRVVDMRWMFSDAKSFEQSLCWDLDQKKIDNIFRDSKGCIKSNCCTTCEKDILCK